MVLVRKRRPLDAKASPWKVKDLSYELKEWNLKESELALLERKRREIMMRRSVGLGIIDIVE